MRERLHTVRFALREAWAVSRVSTVFGFAELVMRILLGARPAMYGLIVGGVVGQDWGLALAGCALLALAEGPALLVTLWGLRHRIGLLQALADRFEGRTALLLAGLPTLSHADDPQSQDRVQALRERGGVIGIAYNNVINALGSLAGPLTAVVVAVSADPRLALLVLAGVPQVLITGRISRVQGAAEEAGSAEGRRSEALVRIAASRRGAGELRSFGARAFLRERLRTSTRAWTSPVVDATRRTGILTTAVTVLYLLVAAAVVLWMGIDALAGTVTIAAMTVALTSVETLRDAVGSIRLAITGLDRSARFITRYEWLVDRERAESRSHAGRELPPATLSSGISLRDLTFTRPGATAPGRGDPGPARRRHRRPDR